MLSEFTFGDNSDKSSIFKIFRLFTHTQRVDWSRQGESDCLIKQVILRLLSSVQCSAYPICVSPWNDP